MNEVHPVQNSEDTGLKLTPISYIGEPVEVVFDKPPALEKKPHCPNGFHWQDEEFRVAALLSEWRDFNRRGRYANNMRPENIKKALRRGSIGVGRFYFQVRTNSGRIFELYYDRATKSVDDRKGSWILFRELEEKTR